MNLRETGLEEKLISGEIDDQVDNRYLGHGFRLKGVGLEVKRGEFVAVIGEIGAGKSSLL